MQRFPTFAVQSDPQAARDRFRQHHIRHCPIVALRDVRRAPKRRLVPFAFLAYCPAPHWSEDPRMQRFAHTLVGGLFVVSLAGCTFMHDLQPHRLWRFNRGPAPSSDPYFSVSDPIPQAHSRRDGMTSSPALNLAPEHAGPVADDE